MQVDVFQGGQEPVIQGRDVLDHEPLQFTTWGTFPARRASRGGKVLPNHQAREIAGRQRYHRESPGYNHARPKHRHPIGHAANLLQLVADEDDGSAFGGYPPQRAHQVF